MKKPANRKPKFRVGQVVAFRHTDSSWSYDEIESIRFDDATAWLRGYTQRMKLEYLRPLTKRETRR
jgi:hypothetical protein